jgi:hypothetical protein
MVAFWQFRAAYKDEAVRVQFIRNALRKTPHVHVDRTAADMLRLFKEQGGYFQAKRSSLAKGRARAKKALADLRWDENLLPVMGSANDMQVNGFLWKYKDEQHLVDSGKHLYGFLQGFERIRDRGTVGDWSLLYHADKNSHGDFVMFILSLLENVSGIDAFKEEIKELGSSVKSGKDDTEKINRSYELFGMFQGLYDRLVELRPSAQEYVLRAA